jgi:hypothetical protein
MTDSIQVTPWTRLPEVEAYAAARGISVEDAIKELVNKGLSHV